MINAPLLAFLETRLGTGSRRGMSNWYTYFCPFCKHHKRKFGVYAEMGNHHYKCFSCGTKGPNMERLGVKLRLPPEAQIKLESLAPNKYSNQEIAQQRPPVQLPAEFVSFTDIKQQTGWRRRAGEQALEYLYGEKRKLTPIDILRYNMGYCPDGFYEHRVIIPCYDAYGMLRNFFARRYAGDRGWGPKYFEPNTDKDEIINFENQIDFAQPIVIVEGAFDAIGIRRNAIPLSGKYIPAALEVRLAREDVTDIYLALDADALTRNHELARYYQAMGKRVYIIEIPSKENDPSQLGFERTNRLIYEAKPFDFMQDLDLSFRTTAKPLIYGKTARMKAPSFADELRDDITSWFSKDQDS